MPIFIFNLVNVYAQKSQMIALMSPPQHFILVRVDPDIYGTDILHQNGE